MVETMTFLWFEKDAEKAVALYVSLIPNSTLDAVTIMPADSPSGPEGSVQVVDFTLAGQPYQAMNAGPLDPFNHAVSLVVNCDTQGEIDRIWDGFLKENGIVEECGWLRDRWGLAWQIVPRQLHEMMKSPDRVAARRTSEAMLKMKKLDLAALERAFDGQ